MPGALAGCRSQETGCASETTARAVFLIQKMDCPTEEKLIRDRIEGMPGIDTLQFNLIQRELTVQHRLSSIDAIMATLKALDMEPAVKSDSLAAAAPDGEPADLAAGYGIPRRMWLLMIVSGLAAIGAEAVAWTSGQESSWPVIALALLAIFSGGLESKLDTFERQGKTAVVLCSAAAPLLILAVADTIRDTSVDAIQRLQQMGVEAVMLTGDNPHTAQAIAAKVGIGDARGDLLPEASSPLSTS